MPQYTPYPKEKDTPSRKSRKGGRNTAFLKNKVAGRLQRKARKERREAIAEARAAQQDAQQEELEVTE